MRLRAARRSRWGAGWRSGPSRLAAGAATAALVVGGTALVGVTAATPVAGAATALRPVSARPAVPKSTDLGTVAATQAISGDVSLAPRNSSELEAYAKTVSTKGSPNYHHYLSPSTIDAAFAPAPSAVAAVEADLRAGGLRVGSVYAGGMLVSFSGTAARVESTFHTAIDRYLLGSGRAVYANTQAAQLPADVAPDVTGVVGLNDLVTPQASLAPYTGSAKHAEKAAPGFTVPTGAANGCSAVTAIAAEDGSLAAQDVAHAYGLDPLYAAGDFGQGRTVDILDLFGFSPSDIQAFDDCYYGTTEGNTVAGNDAAVPVDNGASPGHGQGGSVETELDVETVNAYAPQAKVDVYEAPDSNSGFLDAIAAMTASTASIETISYGSCEETALAEEPGYVQIENELFEEAAAEGHTVFASSADNGDDTCSADSGQPVPPILSDSDPASQPFVTGVGGTAILNPTDPPLEEVWNDGAAGGAGGGGISDIWPEEPWQQYSTVPGINNKTVISEAEALIGSDFCQGSGATANFPAGTNCREVPDVSAQASPNTGGFPLYIDGAWSVEGGTSLASPTWAAVLADIESTKACSAISGNVGFLSPQLYAIASNPTEYAASFTNVTIGNNDNFGIADGLYPATPGYSMAAGLGSPQVTGPGGTDGLAYYLCASPTTTPTVTAIAPQDIAEANGAVTNRTLTITGSGFETSSGTSDVAGVAIGSVALPTADVTVNSATSITATLPSNLFTEEEGNGGAGDGSGGYDVVVTLTGGASSAPSSVSTAHFYELLTSTDSVEPVVAGTFPTAGGDAGGQPVTIYGSGFNALGNPVTSVTFGGVAATSFKVVNGNTITAVTPAVSSSSSTCANGGTLAGTCQVQVQVTLTEGQTSAESTIEPEFSGPTADEPTVQGSGQDEYYPAATEYDYEPTPKITSVTVLNNPALPELSTTYASELGGTEIEIQGSGFGALGLDWVNAGSYLHNNSIDSSFVYISPTVLVVDLPAEGPTTAPLGLPITVQTQGSPNEAPGSGIAEVSPSNTVTVTYAPTPSVTAVVGGVDPSGTYLAGPTSGGSPLSLSGSGFTGAQEVSFQDLKYGFPTTAYNLSTSSSNTSVSLTSPPGTPAALTGVYDMAVCNPSGCGTPSTQTYTYYLPGNPSVISVSPDSAPAGSTVTITGGNLGFLQDVYFGTVKATITGPTTFFQDGDPYETTVVVPAGLPDYPVPVQVTTLESLATGYGKSPVNKAAEFLESAVARPTISASHRIGAGVVTVSGHGYGPTVALYEAPYGATSFTQVATAPLSANGGSYSFKRFTYKTADFYVVSGGQRSVVVRGDIFNNVGFNLTGNYKSYTVKVATDPVVDGAFVTIYQIQNGRRMAVRRIEITAPDGMVVTTIPTSLRVVTVQAVVSGDFGSFGGSSIVGSVAVRQ